MENETSQSPNGGSTTKDAEQDALIRQNAESIRRNEAAILRQTEALEKIRDHYFPVQTPWKRICGFILKVIGAVTVGAGILETADWYWNTRLVDRAARQSAAVAGRLFFQENDAPGAVNFIEKAVELDGEEIKYRIARGFMKGFVAVSDFFDLGRDLTTDERKRIDAILAEALLLQQIAPDEAMPHVLAAQLDVLCGEQASARREIARAAELAPENAQIHVSACAVAFAENKIDEARREIAAAKRIDPKFPLAVYWEALFAQLVDKDRKTALALIDDLLTRFPRYAHGHQLKGQILMDEPGADLPAARAALRRALEIEPELVRAMVPLAETYRREGNVPLARLWLDRALAMNAHWMDALLARAKLSAKTGDWKTADTDLSTAIDLAPLRADLYLDRAKARRGLGETAAAEADKKLAAALAADAAARAR